LPSRSCILEPAAARLRQGSRPRPSSSSLLEASMRRFRRFTAVALPLVLAPCSVLMAQADMPRLVVPAPPASAVRELTDSFQAAGGQRRPFHVYLPQGARSGLPVVFFA